MDTITTEQPIVEVTVELDRDSYTRFGRFALFHWPQNIAMMAVLFIVNPLLTAGAYIIASRRPSAETFALAGGLTGGFLASLLYVLTSRKRAFRKIEQLKPRPTTFAFYEDQVLSQGGTQFAQGSEQMQYELFNRAYETQHAFYMVFHKQKSLILNKKYFSEAETLTLRSLFTRKFGDKFKGMK